MPTAGTGAALRWAWAQEAGVPGGGREDAREHHFRRRAGRKTSSSGQEVNA